MILVPLVDLKFLKELRAPLQELQIGGTSEESRAKMLLALSWGILAGIGVFVGAFMAWRVRPSRSLISAAVAFGGGILLSVATFDLIDEAFATAGLGPIAGGFLAGALLFTLGLLRLDRAGARHRKRSSVPPRSPVEPVRVVALATVLDGIPESVIVGLSFAHGEDLALATMIAVFLSNAPEGLSSTAGMKATGWRLGQIAAVWLAVAVVSSIASVAGYAMADLLPPVAVAVIQSVAAGALLVMIADHMIPEAFAEAHEAAGLVTALGFLCGFTLVEALG